MLQYKYLALRLKLCKGKGIVMDYLHSQEFTIAFTGEHTSPEQVRLDQFAKILAITSTLVEQCAYDVFDTEGKASVYLSDFKAGSIVIELRTMPSAMVDPFGALLQIMTRVQDKQFEPLSFDLREALREFFDTIKRYTKAEHVTFHGRNGKQVVLETSVAIPEPLEIEENTTLYGNLLRLGGKSPTAELQTSRQKVKIKVTEEQARELGKYLYQEIGVTGVATWNLGSICIEKFTLHAIIPPRQHQTWEDALPLLQEEFGKYYADIHDPVAWVRNLRDDDTEEAA